MATFDVLVNGYVRESMGVEHVAGTVSLVRTGDLVIVADPGIMASQSALLDPLTVHGLTVDDVTHVFVSHHHIDHTRNIGMFPTAVVVDSGSFYDGDVWGEHDGDGYRLGTDVEVLVTPGHSFECASLAVRTAHLGTVVLTHAWWFSDMTPVEDPLGVDQEQLAASRRRILSMADWVVPGHGEPFQVTG
jgi:glyoxylase-like metal-dependent hydrolase (beta-lactamase superfamily II)